MRRVAVALGVAVAIVALEIAIPKIDVLSAEIVPLLLLGRVLGLRVTIVLAVLSAPLLVFLDSVLRHATSLSDLALDAGLLVATFVAAAAVVEHGRRAVQRANAAGVVDVRRDGAEARERDVAAIAEAIPQPVWTARSDGSGDSFNAAWLAYTGLSRDESLARGLEAVVHPDDAERMRNVWTARAGATGVFETDFRLRARDGSYGAFVASATPLFADDGVTIVRWFGICTEVATRKRVRVESIRRIGDAARVTLAREPLETSAPPPAALPVAVPVPLGYPAGPGDPPSPVFPDVPGLAFVAVPATRAERPESVTWSDALRLLDGRIVLSAGEVVANGAAARNAVGALRRTIRGAGHVLADPLVLLETADRTARDEFAGLPITAFVGIFDPVAGTLAHASAGHAPPLLREPDGRVTALGFPGTALGTRRTKTDAESGFVVVETRSLLVVFAGGRAGDETHAAVRAALARGADARALGDAMPADADVVPFLALAIDAVPEGNPRRALRWSFATADVGAAARARTEMMAALVAAGASDEEAGDAETIFRELVGNVVRHAPGVCGVALDRAGPLPVLGVLDRGRGRGLTNAGLLPADAFAESGRGLFIARALAVEFNAFPRASGGTHARAVLRVGAGTTNAG